MAPLVSFRPGCGISATRAVLTAPALRTNSEAVAAHGSQRPVAAAARGRAARMTNAVAKSGFTASTLAPLNRMRAPLETRKTRCQRTKLSVSAAALPFGPAAVNVGAIVGSIGLQVAMALKNLLLTTTTAVTKMIDTPWRPEQIWVWAMYFVLLKPALWYSYIAVQGLRGKADKISEANFKESFFGFLNGPLYIHGLGMAFNWLADTIVYVTEFLGFTEVPFCQMIGSWDVGVYIITVGVFLSKLQDYYLDEFLVLVAGKGRVPTGMQDLIHRMLELIIWGGTFYLAGTACGLSSELIASVYSLAGIGFGFASKEVLQNFFGGLMLWTMRPFTIGEDIEFLHPGGKIDIRGRVLKVGYYQTIVCSDQGVTYVPNQWFVAGEINNRSRNHTSFQLRGYQKKAMDAKAHGEGDISPFDTDKPSAPGFIGGLST
mmetsp:Transcript_39966/g.67027  ORF Transcript_39966/g.67027 Transcript_39966/m.67027 type:complete len:431 (-) Transcript_39966:24-1316(-)